MKKLIYILLLLPCLVNGQIIDISKQKGGADTVNDVYSKTATDALLGGKVDKTIFYNVKDYGAVGDSITNETTAFQATFNAISSNNYATIYIPAGKYTISSTLRLFNKAHVKIVCDGILINNLAGTDTLISIYNCRSINVKDLLIDMNAKAHLDRGLSIIKVEGKVNVENCHIYNYGTYNSEGLILGNVGNQNNITGYNEGAEFSVVGCAFYNKALAPISSYNYTNNNSKGIGLVLKDSAEYGRVINCDFYNISEGIISDGGANNTISNCNFESINSYQNGVLQDGGCIYIKDSGGNGGKYTIDNNHMNHNYTRCIHILYDGGIRPTSITNNHFIANNYDAIVIGNTATTRDYIITNNFFDRCYNFLPWASYPMTGNRAFIKLTNVYTSNIQSNIFENSSNYGLVYYGVSNYNNISNNTYYDITTAFDSVGLNKNSYWNNRNGQATSFYMADSLNVTKTIRIGRTDNTYTNALVVSGVTSAAASTQNVYTGASGSTGGSALSLYTDDGAALASGDRIGYIAWGSRKTTGLGTGATIEAFGSSTWATNTPTYLSFSTVLTTTRTERLRIEANGNVDVGTTVTDSLFNVSTGAHINRGLFVGGINKASSFYISTIQTAPSSSTDTGTAGELRFTATGVYICIATNSWIKCTGAAW